VDFEKRTLLKCAPKEASTGVDFFEDPAPPGPVPPGKGIELMIPAVCGGTNWFLATGGRDDTQVDSIQIMQMEPSGPVAISPELDFPGPVTALHQGLMSPVAIVHNLATGNYEAYDLAISCGH